MFVTTLSPSTLVQDAHFPALRDYVISSTGLCFYASRTETLAGHVVNRLREHGLTRCHEYLRLLQDTAGGEEELDQLIELLTIGETYFFRHRQVFDALRERALPEIAARNRQTRRLRIWSAGCSIGAEAYSLAIFLRSDLGHLFDGWNVSILGTDFNRRFLSQASEGHFEEWAFRGTAEELRQDSFFRDGRGWRIRPEFKEGVSFQYHNLVRHPYPSLVQNLAAFDLILCRNVLIYFSEEIVRHVVSRLGECLVPGGWLAIGHAEHNAQTFRSLETIEAAGATLYRKPQSWSLSSSVAEQSWQQPLPAAALSPSPPEAAVPPVLDISFPATLPQAPGRETTSAPPRPHMPSGAPPTRAELGEIRAQADAGQVDLGLRQCEALIHRHPLHATSYFYHALLLDQVGAHGAALRQLQRAIYLDRNYILAHYYLGLTHRQLGDTDEALKAFRNVLRLAVERDPHETLSDADGLTIASLDELTRMHMETLQKP